VLRGRHLQDCESDTCTGCQPCPEAHCAICQRTHDTGACAACLSVARRNLATITRLWPRLEAEAQLGRHATHVGAGIPGGDALVLATPGATEHGRHGQLSHRLATGLDVSHTNDELRTDPRPALAVLLKWESVWRARQGHATDLAPTLDRVASYLGEHLHDMARDGAAATACFYDLASTARALEDVLSEGERPEVTRVPCWECGARLVKVYADKASADHYRCPRCGEVYDRGRFDRAKHDHLASQGAERYVTVADAQVATGRPEKTIRTWAQRQLIATDRDPSTNRLLVWWPHVRAQHMAAGERK
jgi:hypothetical protein